MVPDFRYANTKSLTKFTEDYERWKKLYGSISDIATIIESIPGFHSMVRKSSVEFGVAK